MFRYRQTQNSQKRLEARFAELLKPFGISSDQMTGPGVEPTGPHFARTNAAGAQTKQSTHKHNRQPEKLSC